jgi:hypothetical protein
MRASFAAASFRFVGGIPSAQDHHHPPHSGRGVRWGSDLLNKDTIVDQAANLEKNATWQNPLDHECWDLKDVEKVHPTHKEPLGFVDKAAWSAVKLIRVIFDIVSGYKFGPINDAKVIRRVIFLETIAGVPGMVAGMLRHMGSLRRMKRDHGWIHTLLEEAENERMHLLTFLEIRRPSLAFRSLVLITQGVFFNMFFLAYMCSPRFCHRLVGYIEEEAVITYTHILHEIEKGNLFQGKKCPPVAISYWKLPPDATMKHLIVAIRADEAGHKLVNHTFADMHSSGLQDSTNPFRFVEHSPATMAAAPGATSPQPDQKK